MLKKVFSSKYCAFIGIALLSFGCYLDYTIVNIALPTIEKEFNATLTELQWVMNVYFLVLCVLATLMGKLGDLWGLRRCFYIGVAIFGIASLIAGYAATIEWLIFGRLLQGVGAAIVFPVGLSLLPYSFQQNERTKAIAYLGSLGGIALALGPIIGGFIVETWGWKWIFLINIPIILLGYLFCLGSVKEINLENENIYLDWKGSILLCLALSGLVMGLVQIHSDWNHPHTFIYLMIGIICAILFYYAERKERDPLIDFKDFKNPLFYAGGMLVFSAGIFSAVVLFFAPLYLQIIQGFSSQYAGWILFSIPATVFLVALLTNKLIAGVGILNTIRLSFLAAFLSFCLQLFFSEHTSILYMIVTFSLLGSMWGLGNTVPIIAAQSSVSAEKAAVVTGTMVTLFNIGGAIGLAIAVMIYSFYSSFMSGFMGVILFLLIVVILFLSTLLKIKINPSDYKSQSVRH